MKRKIEPGKSITMVAPYDLMEDQAVVIGKLVGVANMAALEGKPVVLDLEGVFELEKQVLEPFESIAIGAPIYLVEGTGKVTCVPSSSTPFIGVCFMDSNEQESTVQVKINHGIPSSVQGNRFNGFMAMSNSEMEAPNLMILSTLEPSSLPLMFTKESTGVFRIMNDDLISGKYTVKATIMVPGPTANIRHIDLDCIDDGRITITFCTWDLAHGFREVDPVDCVFALEIITYPNADATSFLVEVVGGGGEDTPPPRG